MLLREQYLEDTLLVNELDLYAEDLEEIISGYVYQYTHPESNSVTYFFNGNNENINRKAQLSLLLSDICEKTYPNTPVINNEAINKNDLPGVAVNSRTKVVSGLLTNTLLPNLGLTGTGQDVSVMRSLLIRTGILLNHDTNPTINTNLDDAKLNKLLATIDDFFKASSSENVLNFSELYKALVGKKHGFGIRKGIVPVYLAVIIRKYLNNLVIKFKGNEVRLTASLLNDINTNPDDYTAYIEKIDNDKSKYLSELENIFSDYVVEAEKSLNSFRYIVLAMNRWYMSLPKYTKEMSKIYKGNKEFEPIQQEYIKFIKSLKQIPLNSRDYLFDELPKIFKGCKKIIALTNEIKNYVNTCNNSIGNLSAELCNDLIKIISKNNNSSELRNVIKDWFKTLKESTKSNLFPAFENSVLNVLSNVTNNDMETVQNLCKALTALQIEDWSEKTITDFLERFEEAITTINSFNRNDSIRSNNYNSYKISFIDDKGHETVKQLVKIQYTNRAKLLMNEIKTNIEEMGQSITPQEKRQVLFEILQELC